MHLIPRARSMERFVTIWLGSVIAACLILSAAFLVMTVKVESLNRGVARNIRSMEAIHLLESEIMQVGRYDLLWRQEGVDSLKAGKLLYLDRTRDTLSKLSVEVAGERERMMLDSTRSIYLRFFLLSMFPGVESAQTERAVTDSLMHALNDYHQREAALAQNALSQNYQIRENMRTWLLILLLCMIGVIVVGSVALFRRIIHPAIALNGAAARFVQGDFRTRVNMAHDDEMGNLIRTFNVMAEDISRREKSRLDFTASVVHDIKNPLVIIGAAVRMMRKKNLPLEQRQIWMDRIIREVDRLEDLSQDLMDVVQVESGYLALRKEELSLEELAASICAERSETITTHTLAFEPGESCTILGDRRRLERVIINLLSNAVKYSPEGATVSMKVERRNHQAVFSITDRGVGISPEDIKVLFQPFGRLARTRDMAHGTGLGLYIAKKIIEAHDGSIQVISELGTGTTVEIFLPVAPNPQSRVLSGPETVSASEHKPLSPVENS